MALAVATLGTEIESMVPTLGSSSLVLAEAFGEYFKECAPAVTGATVDSTAVPAMSAAMTFAQPATPLQGATIIATGLAAFWATIVAAPATFFPAALTVVPAVYVALPAILAATFAANTTGGADLAASAAAMASDIHALTDGIGKVDGVPIT